MRVSELAKELGKTSKEVLDVLQKNNQDVSSHSSNVNEAQIGMVKKALNAGASRAAEGRRCGTEEEAGSGISSAEFPAETGSAEAGSTPAGTEHFCSGAAGS